MPRFSRLRSWLEQLLHTHDTPHRTAGAYALGVFLAFSPMLGLHTVLGIALAFLLGLNRVAVILGVYTNLPWLVPAYYTMATIAAAAVMGIEMPPGALEEGMDAALTGSWRDAVDAGRRLEPLMWAFIVGSTVGAVVLSAVAYRGSLAMILAHRKRVAMRSQESAKNSSVL